MRRRRRRQRFVQIRRRPHELWLWRGRRGRREGGRGGRNIKVGKRDSLRALSRWREGFPMMMCRWWRLLFLGVCFWSLDQASQLLVVLIRRIIVMFVVGSRGRLGVKVAERVGPARWKTARWSHGPRRSRRGVAGQQHACESINIHGRLRGRSGCIP